MMHEADFGGPFAFDPAAAGEIWRLLSDDPDTLMWAPGGCTMMNRAVAEIADWHLTHDAAPSENPDQGRSGDGNR